MFFGWIPTNRGEISYEYISIPEYIKKYVNNFYQSSNFFYAELNLDFLNDSDNFSKISKRKNSFVEQSCRICITKNLKGRIYFYIGNSYIHCNFNIERNGKVTFKIIKNRLNEIENLSISFIKQAIYTIIKIIVHGDAHHHQKIDTILPVMDDAFDAVRVAKALTDHIKRVERNVKLVNECHSKLKNFNTLYESKGYLAYFKTFAMLFSDKKVQEQYEFAKNVVDSLEQINNKRKEKDTYKDKLIAAALTFVGLFISINILLNGFDGDMCIPLIHKERFISFSFVFLIVSLLFYKFNECVIRSYLYYKRYDLFEMVEYIRRAKYSDLNWKGKLIKLLPLLFFIILMYSLQYVLLFNK